MPPDALSRYLGLRLRAAREQRGLSVAETAAGLGVSAPTLTAWESGQDRPRPSQLLRAAEFFGQPITFFFSGAPKIDLSHYGVLQLEALAGAQAMDLAIMRRVARISSEPLKGRISAVIDLLIDIETGSDWGASQRDELNAAIQRSEAETGRPLPEQMADVSDELWVAMFLLLKGFYQPSTREAVPRPH